MWQRVVVGYTTVVDWLVGWLVGLFTNFMQSSSIATMRTGKDSTEMGRTGQDRKTY